MLLTGLVAVALSAAAPPAGAQVCMKGERLTKEAIRFYEHAMEHMVDEDWKGAIADLEKALKIHPRAIHQEFVVRETRFSRRFYLPHYYLGICQYNDGDCAGFLRSRIRSRNGGCILVHHPAKEQELDLKRMACMERQADGAAAAAASVTVDLAAGPSLWPGASGSPGSLACASSPAGAVPW